MKYTDKDGAVVHIPALSLSCFWKGVNMIFIELLKVILLGIVEGITEWLPISSTGHMILVDEFIKLNVSEAFMEFFLVVIQLGAILAVVVLYWNKLWPFYIRKIPKKTQMALRKQPAVPRTVLTFVEKYCDKDKWILWFKILVACLPTIIIALPFNDIIEKKFYNYVVVAIMLIVYGVLFIIVEKHNAGKKPSVTKISQLSVQMLLWIGFFQMLALIPGTSRSGATIVGALLIGVSREVAAEFTFFLAIPAMFGASLLKLIKFGFHFTGAEFALLMLGCIVSFGLSVIAIKFLMGYIKQHDFKVFGYYRIVLGALIILWTIVQTVIA